MNKYKSYSHSYGESYLHLQFTPKKRRKPFRNREVMAACRYAFERIAASMRIALVSAEFGPDHSHIFLRDWKNWSIPQLAQRFKGASSYALRERFPWLRSAVNEDSFWSDGYFHETVGSVTAQARQFYIERCQKKHWVAVDFPDWLPNQTQIARWVH
jgi:putative transposase